MDIEEETRIIKLRSMPDENGETQVFEIPYAAAMISDLVKDAIGDHEDEDDGDEEEENAVREVGVLRVKGPCLAKAVDFMKHHHIEKMKEIPTPLGGSSFNEVGRVIVVLSRSSPNRGRSEP